MNGALTSRTAPARGLSRSCLSVLAEVATLLAELVNGHQYRRTEASELHDSVRT